MTAPRLEFRDVRKTFRVRNRSDALRDAIPRALGRLFGRGGGDDHPFVALDGVSFRVGPGEVVGIVGANGAGKSTSLRLAAGIYRPDRGAVEVNGRVSALIELQAGFHPDLSGIQNIYLVGALLGLLRKQMDALRGDILEFADIGEFSDNPVRTYSTGMAVRLGFAVAAYVPCEILLVDEVLAVGDMDFQSKCLRRLSELRERGVSVLFVSHNLQVVEQFCDRVLFVHHGKVLAEGQPRETLDAYRKFLAHEKSLSLLRESATPRMRRGTGEIKIDAVSLDGGAGGGPGTVRHGGTLRIAATWRAEKPVEQPVLGISIQTIQGVLCEQTRTLALPRPIARLHGEGTLSVEFPDVKLLPGNYEVSVYATDRTGLLHYDLHQALYPLKVVADGPLPEDGIVALGPRWSVRGSGMAE